MLNPKILRKILTSFLFALLFAVPVLYFLSLVTGFGFLDLRDWLHPGYAILCPGGCGPTNNNNLIKSAIIAIVFLPIWFIAYKFTKQVVTLGAVLVLSAITYIYSLAFYYFFSINENPNFLIFVVFILPFILILLWYVVFRKYIYNLKRTLVLFVIVVVWVIAVKLLVVATIYCPPAFVGSDSKTTLYKTVFNIKCDYPIMPTFPIMIDR